MAVDIHPGVVHCPPPNPQPPSEEGDKNTVLNPLMDTVSQRRKPRRTPKNPEVSLRPPGCACEEMREEIEETMRKRCMN